MYFKFTGKMVSKQKHSFCLLPMTMTGVQRFWMGIIQKYQEYNYVGVTKTNSRTSLV